jgi:hypothetical protein
LDGREAEATEVSELIVFASAEAGEEKADVFTRNIPAFQARGFGEERFDFLDETGATELLISSSSVVARVPRPMADSRALCSWLSRVAARE